MNGTRPVRIGYVESALQIVRDCLSRDPSRATFCNISTVIGSVSAILLPIMILVGTAGNLVVAHVMLSRQRPLTRQNIYLGCIAIADIVSLIVIGMFNGFLTKGLSWITGGKVAFFIYNLSDTMCKVSRYALNFCHVLSCLWLLVLVTDRVLVVRRPLAMKRVGRRWAVRALVGTALFAGAVALPNAFLVGHQTVTLKDGSGTVLIYCYRPKWAQMPMLIYTTVMSNPPTLIILVMLGLDCFLLSRVVSAVSKRRVLSNGNIGAQDRSLTHGISGTILVFILAIVYLGLHTPLLLARPYIEVSLDILDIADNLDYLTLVANIYYSSMIFSLVNQCITFFILLWRRESFRRCVLSMLPCRNSANAHRQSTPEFEMTSSNTRALDDL